MCLISFAYKYVPGYNLIVAANRDEFLNRPSAKAKFWSDHPNVLAGRDLEGQGTWMGITKSGRFAALTNFREPNLVNNARTRGELVSRFLYGNESPDQYMNNVKKARNKYNGFNLLVGDSNTLLYYSNKQNKITELEPGLYGLSNEFLNSSWPKVEKGKASLASCLTKSTDISDCLFKGLTNSVQAPDSQLPNTGVGQQLERELSPVFIRMPNYGTRSSTVLIIKDDDHTSYTERTYLPQSLDFEEVNYTFTFKNK